jgi:hypothetical protein
MSAALPDRVLAAVREPGRVTGVVATVDERGKPHTAPFGSVQAVSPSTLRFGCDRRHDTYANLLRSPSVVVCLLLPPDIAVSVSGRATVIREAMETADTDAVFEIEIDDVKDDMLPGAAIDSGVTYSIPEELAGFLERYVAEVRDA